MTAEGLLNTLKNLKDKEFDEFKWHLKQPGTLGSYQIIKVSDLERASSRQDTVDLMESTYTLRGALDVTRRVLVMINRKDLVSSLTDTNSGKKGSGERRIILVGKTGVGKSSSGNTIFGREVFAFELSELPQSIECRSGRGMVGERMVTVTDTPGLFDTSLTNEDMLKRIKLCIGMSAPGPHAFLLVLRLDRITEQDKQTVKMIQTTFGEDADKYTMVLFTHGDKLKKKTIQEFVSKSKDLQHITQKYHGRYHVFNNNVKDPSQVSQLLEKTDNMVSSNGALPHYTTDMFLKAEKAIEEEEKQRLRKELEANRKEEEEQRAKYEEEKERLPKGPEAERIKRTEDLKHDAGNRDLDFQLHFKCPCCVII